MTNRKVILGLIEALTKKALNHSNMTILDVCEHHYARYVYGYVRGVLPFSAITFEAGFMIAESAVMGRRMGFPESARSMIIT